MSVDEETTLLATFDLDGYCADDKDMVVFSAPEDEITKSVFDKTSIEN